MSFDSSHIPKHVKVIAVSKTQPSSKIRKAFQEGFSDFGENYIQEFLEKESQLSDLKIRWHFIGHLQKNKVKFCAGKFTLIHSVDSLELASKLNQHCQQNEEIQKILLEVNLASEESKTGFSENSLLSCMPVLSQLSNVQICGLMTMPPLQEDPEKNRTFFRRLRELRDQLLLVYPMMKELSMGTSGDYQVAIEEGSTMIRVGTAIFGERAKNESTI